MTTILLIFLAGFFIATVAAPAWQQRRARRRELDRCGGPVIYPTNTPRFTRDDPSPRPRRRQDA